MEVPSGSAIRAVTFSSDGTQIVSGSVDKSVRVWDASTGAELNALKGHTSSVSSVAFSKRWLADRIWLERQICAGVEYVDR